MDIEIPTWQPAGNSHVLWAGEELFSLGKQSLSGGYIKSTPTTHGVNCADGWMIAVPLVLSRRVLDRRW